MTKMDAKSSHRRSCANSSALPVQLVWRRLDVPYSGSGSPGSAVLQLEKARKQPSELPRCGPRCRHASLCTQLAKPPFAPQPATLRCHSGRVGPSVSALATSVALYATLQGQQAQCSTGAPSSGAKVPARARESSSSAQGARLITKLYCEFAPLT